MKRYSYLIGFIVGTFILAPLVIKLYSYFRVNQVMDKDVTTYISNSEEIKLFLNKKFEPSDAETYKDGYNFVSTFPFYSKQYSKYFALKNYYKYGYWDSAIEHANFNYDIIAYVNKDEMNNPDMGTEKKPIPVLKIIIPNKDSIEVGDRDTATANISNVHHRFNVHEYLMYTMSHRDFNRMFKK